MKIVITKEDIGERPYSNPYTCPMATKLKKELGLQNVTFFLFRLSDGETGKRIGDIDPQFGARQYSQLKRGEIDIFETEYTPINN